MPAPSRAIVLQHGLVRVRLDRIADERVLAAEGIRKHAVVALERSGRIAIERRPDLGRQPREAHALGVEDAALVGEVMHGKR